MLRVFTLTSRKLLISRTLPSLLPLTADVAHPSTTSIYDVRRNKKASEYHNTRFPLIKSINPLLPSKTYWEICFLSNGMIRWSSGKPGLPSFQMPDPNVIICNYTNMLKCVDLQDMKDAPPAAFWWAMVLGGSQLVFPILQVIGGYCPVLNFFQLYSAALFLAFKGGERWGAALSGKKGFKPDWETARLAAIPSAIAILGLLMPYPLGFLTVQAGVITSLYLDLKSCAYPPWGNALNVFITLATVVGLALALIAYLLCHNSEKKEAKENKKDKNKEEKNKQDAAEQGKSDKNGDKVDKKDKNSKNDRSDKDDKDDKVKKEG